MPRLILISDTHGNFDSMPPIPDGDILIHAGDLLAEGQLSELDRAAQFFSSLPHRYKILVAGNHDWCFEKEREAAEKLLPGVIYLQDRLVELMGLKIYGSPWSPRLYDLAFNLDRGEPLKAVWERIPPGIDVLITHTPPFGIADYSAHRQKHMGCEDLLAAVCKIRPALHVFGHMHGGYGITRQEDIIFCNASTCNEQEVPVNQPLSLDLNCRSAA